MNKRYPQNKLDEAAMQVIACAGWDIVVADEDKNGKEKETLKLILKKLFTDNPEAELMSDPKEREVRLENAIALINAEGNERNKESIVSYLVELMFVDGLRGQDEDDIIIDIAGKLNLDKSVTHAIIDRVREEAKIRIIEAVFQVPIQD